MSSAQYIEAIAKRRSIYALGDKLPASHAEITKLIEDTIRHCPSSFNVQSSRAVILYGNNHKKVWAIAKEQSKKVLSPEIYAIVEGRANNSFIPAAGTILFYEDKKAIEGQQDAHPSVAEHFPLLSQHHSAMVQFAVWSALAQDGIGASLQHNIFIEAELQKAFGISPNWQLVAQMPFGSIEKAAEEKSFIPDEGRFLVFDE